MGEPEVRRLHKEIDRIKGQRDRLRHALIRASHRSWEDAPTRAEMEEWHTDPACKGMLENGEILLPGDMTEP